MAVVVGSAMLLTVMLGVSEEVATVAEQVGVDPIELQGAVNVTGYGPDEYLCLVGEGPCPKPVYTVWDRVHECEAPGNWHANTGNGFYGGLQFDRGSWIAAGGGKYAARADLATREQQIEIANRWLAMTSWRSWPACSRRLGLR